MKDFIFISKWVLVFAILAIGALFISSENARAQAVGIGIAVPDSSALLQLQSTSKGLLMPRMTDAQIAAIFNPVKGDIAYSTTSKNFFFYNGYFWTELVGYGWSLSGNSGTSPATNFLGTIDAKDVIVRSNSLERLLISNGGGVGLWSNSNVAEEIRMYEPSGIGASYTGFKATAQAGNVHYTLPTGDGSPSSTLITNGSGTMSWHTFLAFTGGDSTGLWQRGAPGTLLGDSAINVGGGIYSIAVGLSNNGGGQYSSVWGENNTVGATGGSISGGNGNTVVSYSVIRGGVANGSLPSLYAITYNGLNNNQGGKYTAMLDGDSNSFGADFSTIINGAKDSINNKYVLVFGTKMTINTSNEVCFKPSTTTTLWGIGTCSPVQAADVVGNVKFSGSLKPNNAAGLSPKQLFSAGSGSPPTWNTAVSIATTNWGLSGTGSTNPSTNFIGTTDTQDVAIRTGNAERARISSIGNVGIGTTTPRHKLQSVYSGSTDEKAAIFANANASSAAQSVGVWGSGKNASSSNTGTLGVLCSGGGNTTAGATNPALQVSQGEFTMGRTVEAASAGTIVDPAAAGTAYSQEGASGIVQLSLGTDLHDTTTPTNGVYQDLGTVTINNEFIGPSSIVVADVVAKTYDGGLDPSPKNAIYRVDVASRSAGSCVVRIGMIPFVTSGLQYTSGDYIRIAYAVINPGR